MTTPRRAAITLVAALLLLVGCGGDDDDTTASTTTAATSTTSASPEATTTATTTETVGPTAPTDPPTDTLPDGEHHVYFQAAHEGTVEGQAVTMVMFDKVELLTGEAAVAAAIEHGDLEEGETALPNDYYIVNDNPKVRMMAVVPEAQVTVLDGGTPDTMSGSVDEVADSDALFTILVQNVRGISTITAIEQVYLP